jgi:Zn-dependent M28 family amino/carboxypeptidase
MRRRALVLLATVAAATVLSAGAALLVASPKSVEAADSPALVAQSAEMDASAQLRQAVSVEGLMAHEKRLQDIANANGGTRYVGTPGYAASVDYVANQLRAAGYNVTVQSFQVQLPLGATRTTSNVIAETATGDPAHTIVVGAHLDSKKTPGINDNGSGVASVLEIARQMSRLGIKPANRVRFAFWGAEEPSPYMLGSKYYVNHLSPQQLDSIEMYLNFDSLSSTNYVRFVYDGDNLQNPSPPGSGQIEKVFTDYYAAVGLPTKPHLKTSSDLAPFMEAGIPAGWLFTGTNKLKTAQEAAVYGGTAGKPYDPCYHQPCDTLNNVSTTALDQTSDGAAHATLTLANRAY